MCTCCRVVEMLAHILAERWVIPRCKYISTYIYIYVCVYVCTRFLGLRISRSQGRQRTVSPLGVVNASLPVSRAGDSNGFQVAFSFE